MMASTIMLSEAIWKALPMHVSHMSLRAEKVSLFASKTSSSSSKVKMGSLSSLPGDANTSTVSCTICGTLHHEHFDFAYTAHALALCENYLRTIIISLVGKNAVNTIRIQFKSEIYSWKYGMYNIHIPYAGKFSQLKIFAVLWLSVLCGYFAILIFTVTGNREISLLSNSPTGVLVHKIELTAEKMEVCEKLSNISTASSNVLQSGCAGRVPRDKNFMCKLNFTNFNFAVRPQLWKPRKIVVRKIFRLTLYILRQVSKINNM